MSKTLTIFLNIHPHILCLHKKFMKKQLFGLCKKDKNRCSKISFHETFLFHFYPSHKNAIFDETFCANIAYAGAYSKKLFGIS